MDKAQITALHSRYSSLLGARSSWDALWESLSELFLPFRWKQGDRRQGVKVNPRLMNSCGVLAARVLAAGLQGGMTSPARPWFKIGLKGNPDAGELNTWLDELTQRMHLVLHESNFYNAVHGLYADLAVFGTALLVETADADGLKFFLVPPGDYVLDINKDGEVDTFFRRIPMTARQIRTSFGKDVPSFIESAAKAGLADTFYVLHGVFPRKDRDHTATIGPLSMPYQSVYWLEEGGHILSEGGYSGFPAFAPRWDVGPGEIYGRSPAMDVLADLKMLQAMTVTMRTLQHKLADPPMVADSSLKQYGINISPGAINFANAAAILQNGAIQPIAMPNPASLNFTMQAIQDVENTIREGMYVDLFRMFMDEDRTKVTATEIQAKQQEKLILAGPVVERLHKELLEPLIARTFHLMDEYGALPPLDGDFEGAELETTFESVLAQAQKLAATSSIDQGWAFVLQTAQADPSALDVIDTDAMVKSYLKRTGMPGSCINDDETIAQIRQARQQARQQQEEAAQMAQFTENAEGLTQAAKNLGQTPAGADGQTLMQTLIGGLDGAA